MSQVIPVPSAWARLPKLVSLVIPVFCEEKGILHFTEILLGVMRDLGLPFEIIFVEDDSPDGTLAMIRELHRSHPMRIRALSLSRRFGHQASLAAGLETARGNVVITMDGDMQHPPSLVPTLLWKWSQGHQLVYTRRQHQQGRSWPKEFASRLFYHVLNRVTDVHLEEGTADFRLLDRVVVDALRRISECGIFYRGLVQWAGYRRTAIDYVAPRRFAGSSSYTWKWMLQLGLDAIFNFSLRPLRVSYVLGGCRCWRPWVMLSGRPSIDCGLGRRCRGTLRLFSWSASWEVST